MKNITSFVFNGLEVFSLSRERNFMFCEILFYVSSPPFDWIGRADWFFMFTKNWTFLLDSSNNLMIDQFGCKIRVEHIGKMKLLICLLISLIWIVECDKFKGTENVLNIVGCSFID